MFSKLSQFTYSYLIHNEIIKVFWSLCLLSCLVLEKCRRGSCAEGFCRITRLNYFNFFYKYYLDIKLFTYFGMVSIFTITSYFNNFTLKSDK